MNMLKTKYKYMNMANRIGKLTYKHVYVHMFKDIYYKIATLTHKPPNTRTIRHKLIKSVSIVKSRHKLSSNIGHSSTTHLSLIHI